MPETESLDHEHKLLLKAEQRLVRWINRESDEAVKRKLESELSGIRSKIADHVRSRNGRQEATDKKYMFR